jgi:hypothetical protein
MNDAAKPIDIDPLLRGSWRLLRAYPVIVVPLVAVGAATLVLIVGWIVFLATHPPPPDTAVLSDAQEAPLAMVAPAMGLCALLCLFAAMLAFLATYAMADDLWQTGSTSLARGVRAAFGRLGASIVAGIGLIGLSIVAVIVAIPTLGASFLAMIVFTMYVLSAVVGGGRGGLDAIAESFRLALRYFGASAITSLVLYAVQYAAQFAVFPAIMVIWLSTLSTAISGQKAAVMIVGLSLAGVLFVLGQAVMLAAYSYHALMLCGLYRSMRSLTEQGATV